MTDKFTLSVAFAFFKSSDWGFALKYLVLMAIFIYLLWIFSKYITKKNYISLKDKNIKVLERVALSNDKYIILVELENIFYLIGIDKQGMTVIDKRDDLSLDMFIGKAESMGSFSEQLKSSILKRKNTDDAK